MSLGEVKAEQRLEEILEISHAYKREVEEERATKLLDARAGRDGILPL